jgi:hypothetical protein
MSVGFFVFLGLIVCYLRSRKSAVISVEEQARIDKVEAKKWLDELPIHHAIYSRAPTEIILGCIEEHKKTLFLLDYYKNSVLDLAISCDTEIIVILEICLYFIPSIVSGDESSSTSVSVLTLNNEEQTDSSVHESGHHLSRITRTWSSFTNTATGTKKLTKASRSVKTLDKHCYAKASWFNLLSNDKNSTLLQAIMNDHFEFAEQLCGTVDEQGRTALRFSSPMNQEILRKSLYFMGRFDLPANQIEHPNYSSLNCTVVIGQYTHSILYSV